MRRFSITIKTLICQLGPFIIPDWELRLRLKRELDREGRGGVGRASPDTADELKSHQEVSASYKTSTSIWCRLAVFRFWDLQHLLHLELERH